MENNGANTMPPFGEVTTQKRSFRCTSYSFSVGTEFNPSPTGYHANLKNNKYFVNLNTKEERRAFFADLKDQNLRANEIHYEYFVKSVNQANEPVTFTDLKSKLDGVVQSDDQLKNLVRMFKIIPQTSKDGNKNYKVVVTNYKLANKLNALKEFAPYRHRSNNKVVNVSTNKTESMTNDL